jgi:hypothetical protein
LAGVGWRAFQVEKRLADGGELDHPKANEEKIRRGSIESPTPDLGNERFYLIKDLVDNI